MDHISGLSGSGPIQPMGSTGGRVEGEGEVGSHYPSSLVAGWLQLLSGSNKRLAFERPFMNLVLPDP